MKSKVGAYMIITTSPFPAVEHIYEVDTLTPFIEANANGVQVNILSKGIHSAETMKLLQEEPILLSIMGGFAGKYIKNHLDKRRIKTDIVWSDAETPHSAKINVSSQNIFYKVKRNSYELLEKEIIRLDQKLKIHYKHVSTMILAGYIPIGIDPALYKNWIKDAKMNNIKTVLSTGQKHILDLAVEEIPYALMFTEEQLKVLGVDISSYEKIIENMQHYLSLGIHYIGIYLKNRDSLMLSKSKKCVMHSFTSINESNNVSESGAFLGAFAIGINRKYEQEKLAKLCLASAFATNLGEDKKSITKKDIDMLFKKVKIREI